MGAINGLVLISPNQFSYSGTGGQILNQGQISYNAVTNLTIDNIFSKEYDDYCLLLRYTGTANGEWLYIQYRFGGVNNSSSFYSLQHTRGYYNSTNNTTRVVNTSSAYVGWFGSNNWNNITQMNIYNPYLPLKTIARTDSAGDYTNTYTHSVSNSISTFNQAIPFDGIRIFPGSGTITGTMNIYGVRK